MFYDIFGWLVLFTLVSLVIWRIVRYWQRHMRINRYGKLVWAQVREVKREARLTLNAGGLGHNAQKYTYENFVYARWQDPHDAERVYNFRLETSDFHRFHVGERIPILLNPRNANEYRLAPDHIQPATPQPLPHRDPLLLPEQAQYQTPYQREDG